MKLAMALCCFTVLILPRQIEAQDQKTQQSQESVRSFVREFYAWYMEKVVLPGAGRGSDLALKLRPKVFSSDLFRALKEDTDAQAKAKGEIVGLDFDPFLNTQDPCEHYEVGGVVPREQTFRVEVFGICRGKKNENPDVIAEVGQQNGHWVFTDFIYKNLEKEFPDNASLLAILKTPHQGREGSKRKP